MNSIKKISILSHSVPKGFSNLLKTGIERLEKSGTNYWSDFNSHDPGITLLDILAYTLSELGLDTDQSIEDIIASQINFQELQWRETFPLPTQILTTFPHNLLDLRKLFLSLLTPLPLNPYLLQNIFIRPARIKPSIYYKDSDGILSFSSNGTPLNINGLYELSPEFTGDALNKNTIKADIPTLLGLSILPARFFFPHWDELDALWAGHEISAISLVDDPNNPNDPVISFTEGQFEDFFCEAGISFGGVGVPVHIPVYIQMLSEFDSNSNDLKVSIKNLLEDTANIQNPIIAYRARYAQLSMYVKQMSDTYNRYRCLGEDVERFRALKVQDIGVKLELEINAGADPITLLAQLYLKLEEEITPPLIRKSLAQVFSKERDSLEDILQGPFFESGWIEDIDLTSASIKQVIYTSDLVRIIMGFQEVIGVNALNLSSYINNIKVAEAIQSCLKISGGDYYVPRFNAELSNVVFKRSNSAIILDFVAVEAVLEDLRNQKRQREVPNVLPEALPLGIPLGIERYRSIQYDFPDLYHLGKNRPSDRESAALKGLSKQWKAFTFFFDQIIADHHRQVANLGETFAITRSNHLSFPVANLFEEPAIGEILDNAYPDQHILLASNLADYMKRRSNVLNHLMSRFSEDLTEYEMTNRGIFGTSVEERIIRDKELFLKDYPVFSQKRVNGLDLSMPDSHSPLDRWNNANISGYELNLKRRLGIRIVNRRKLSRNPDSIMASNGAYPAPFQLLDPGSNPVWESIIAFPNKTTTFITANEVFHLGIATGSYEPVFNNLTQKWYLVIKNKDGQPLVKSLQEYDHKMEANNAISIHQEIILNHFSEEGLFLVEHILLRPKRVGDDADLLKPLPGIKDPYSFILTLVFPSGYGRDFSSQNPAPAPVLSYNRFKKPEFRQYTNKVVQEETPAHCIVQVFFLDADINGNETGLSLNRFERLYGDWIKTPDPRADTQEKFALIRFLNDLYA